MDDNSPVMTNTTSDVNGVESNDFHKIEGIIFDFYEMASTDWDEVHDGEKLTPRAYTMWNALNIIRLTLGIWILTSHLALILVVLAKQVLRNQPKNLLIVNVALANMILGVFVIPMKLHFILNPKNVQCYLAVVWTFIADYYQPSLTLSAVLCLVFERFIYVYTEKAQKNVRPWAAKIGTAFLMIAAWILSCMFLLPIFYAGLLARHSDPQKCLFKVNEIYFVVSQLLSFILPSLGVFILAPFTGLLDCLRPKRCFYKPLTPRGESMTVTAIVSLCSIFCEAPYCVIRVLMMTMQCNNPFCSRFSEALTIAMWVRISKAAVFPFIWLLYTDIRDAVLCKLNSSTLKDEDSDDDGDDDHTKFKGDIQKFPLAHSSSKIV